MAMTQLVELPRHPDGLAWPTESWPRGPHEARDPSAFERHANASFDLTTPQGTTYALLVVKHGRIVYERYAAGANDFYLQYSWSTAKSITQALVGIAVRQGRLDVNAPAPV